MIKVKRCYGRKQPKEKSFVTEFFDGCSNTPTKTAIDACLPKVLQDQDKENVPTCISLSPVLYQSFNFDNSEIKKPLVEQKKFKAKNIGPPKRIKGVQGSKNCKKKPKEAQHFSTKQCQLLQPCWSEILKHEFVVQKLGNDNRPKAEEFRTKSLLRSSTTKAGLNESKNEINYESCSSKIKAGDSQCFPEFFIDNSSGDLFLKPESSELRKKLNTHGHKKGNSESKNKHRRSTQHSMVLSEYDNKKECISKTNEIYGPLNSPEFSITSSGELFLSNLKEKKFVKKKCIKNCITNRSQQQNINSESAGTKLGSNCSLSSYNSKKDILPYMKDVSNVTACGVQHAHNQIQNYNDLVTNFSRASNFLISGGDLANISKHFEDAAACMQSKNSDNERKCNFIHSELHKSENYHDTLNFNSSADKNVKNNQIKNMLDTKLKSDHNTGNDNIKDVSNDVQNVYNQIQSCNDCVTNFSRAQNFPICGENLTNISEYFEDAASCMLSETSDKEGNDDLILDEFKTFENDHKNSDFYSSTDKYAISNQRKKRNGTKLKSYSNVANDNFENLANTLDFFGHVTYSDAASKKRNDSKIKADINFSPLLVEKSKFTTSTPLIKNKSLAHFSINFLQTPLHGNDNINGQFSSNLYLHNLYKTGLMSDYMRHSSQIKACTISSRSSKSLIIRNSAAISNPNKSFMVSQNKSFSVKEPDEFTKAKILRLCNQESVASFSDIYNWNKLKVKKIGEGTYGEVFLITKLKLSYVLKVIPVSQYSDDGFQDLQSVLSEIQISKCLSELRNNKMNKTKNFTNIRRSLLVCGSYPSELLNAWDDFKQVKSCYNNRPDIFEDNQLFAILELEFGGKDMSCFVLRNALEAESILKQIAVSLAVAEEEYLFEHRDLHLGNILIERVKRKNISYKLQGKDISFTCHGVHVTIIDFTLSRLYKDGYMYYYDLAEEDSLFEQSGDYQFGIYKSMRKHLENQWEECSLYSNVLWLKYLCKKLIEFKYSRPSSAAHLIGLKAVEAFSSRLMNCKSAFDSLTKCEITPIVFEKLAVYSDISKMSVLVSRNSTLKSKISMGK